jgi:hypothetical protein
MTWDDISLWQWQQLQMLDSKKSNIEEHLVIIETISILTGKTKNQILDLSKKQVKKIVNDIEFLYLKKPNVRQVNSIIIGKRKYKFNYDVKLAHAGRYIETKYFLSDFHNNIHKIAASMVTPMRLTWRGWVEEEFNPYNHEEYANDLLSASFIKVFGSVYQWVLNIKELDNKFKGLYNKDNQEPEEERPGKGSFMKNFGWIYQASLVSEFEKIKLEDVYQLSTIQFLNDLSYLSAKSNHEAEQRKKVNGK